MLISKSNAWSNWVLSSVFAFALIVCSAASAPAQFPGGGGSGAPGGSGGGTGGTGGGGTGGRGGQQGAGPQASGGAILDPATAFGNEVARKGAVGQFTEPVGASVTSAAASLSTTGPRGRTTGGGLGGMGGGLGAAFSNNLTTGAAGGSESATPLRTRLRSGIALPPASIEAQIAQEINVNNRLQRTSTLNPQPRDRGQFFPGADGGLSARPHYGVNVQMQGRTAILQGTVSSTADRRMSELLIRLEPGVSQVENRINVAQ